MQLFEKLILLYLLLINLYAFTLMRIDKSRSVRDRRHRIPERKLLGISAAGGSLGALAAMRLFRHKTKHAAFAAGIPFMLVAHLIALYLLGQYVF